VVAIERPPLATNGQDFSPRAAIFSPHGFVLIRRLFTLSGSNCQPRRGTQAASFVATSSQPAVTRVPVSQPDNSVEKLADAAADTIAPAPSGGRVTLRSPVKLSTRRAKYGTP
jgi:hypothetical protein